MTNEELTKLKVQAYDLSLRCEALQAEFKAAMEALGEINKKIKGSDVPVAPSAS